MSLEQRPEAQRELLARATHALELPELLEPAIERELQPVARQPIPIVGYQQVWGLDGEWFGIAVPNAYT